MPNPRASDPQCEGRGDVQTLNFAVRTEDQGPMIGDRESERTRWFGQGFAFKGNLCMTINLFLSKQGQEISFLWYCLKYIKIQSSFLGGRCFMETE